MKNGVVSENKQGTDTAVAVPQELTCGKLMTLRLRSSGVVSRLRAKVDFLPKPALIHTLRGAGYCLRED